MAISVLFIDIEGGWGGSSRSLYYLVKYLEKKRCRPVILMGKHGPIKEKYENDKIGTFLFTPIPRTTAMQDKNIKGTLLFLFQLIYLPGILSLIKKIKKQYSVEIIHLNHESLFFLGFCIKVLFRTKLVYHVRTMIPKNFMSRIQVFTAISTADHLIYITENEKKRWNAIYPKSKKAKQTIIYNIAESVDGRYPSSRLNTVINKFKVISLMTVSYRRGTDRMVDVAYFLNKRNMQDIVFIVCGKTEGICEIEMRERIEQKGLGEFFLFLGHQDKPEEVLKECDILIRPSREYNPWGRDIIEALTLGKPVIAIGNYDKFIEDGINGYLLPEFNIEEIAEKIIYLAGHPEVTATMKKANTKKAKRLFDGTTNAAKVAAIYDSLIKS